MLLAQAMVVFVGIAGKHPEAIERQLAPVIAHAHLTTRTIATADLASLARHSDNSRSCVQDQHVDGLVAAALIESGGARTLRVVIYDGDGGMVSLAESPVSGATLSKGDLETLSANLDDEISELVARRPAHEPAHVAAREAAPVAAREPVAAFAPTPAKAEPPEISFDTDDAAELPPAPPTAAHHDAAPTQTADAVSLDDVAALNSGEPEALAASAAPPQTSSLHIHANAGLGLVGRSFSGPATVPGYSSSPVGSVQLEGGLSPTDKLSLTAVGEQAIDMTTPLGKTVAATSMSRWEITASYTVTNGRVKIAPTIGVGERSFSIDSDDPQRSPDADYGYVVLGANATMPIGSRFVLRGLAAFEPVVSGADPMALAFGSSTRWAFEVGAGLDIRVASHMYARAALNYQQFSWGWDAGTRGASGAVDSYPTGTVSVGADY